MKKLILATATMLLLAASNYSIAQTNGASSVKTGAAAGKNAKSPVGSKTEQELMKITQELTAASRRGDKKVFEKYLADNYFSTNMDGSVRHRVQVIANMNPAPAYLRPSPDFEDIQVQEYGNTAIMSLKFNSRYVNDGQQFTLWYRATDVFMKQDGQWKLLSRHTSIIPVDKTAAKVDPAVYDAYVGQYKITDENIITITREGDRLMAQGDWETTKTELLPENETTFYSKGIRKQTTFVKDDKGQVSHINVRLADGQELKRKKIK